MKNHKILISACLLGEKVRYDGNSQLIENNIIRQWSKNAILISICPEVSGGLSIPRLPAEIQADAQQKLKIINNKDIDVTKEFIKGAQNTLEQCLQHKIQIAILTEGSPSCGSQLINDGNFQSKKIQGQGITTRLLEKNSITVFNQYQIQQAYEHYQKLIK